jgi:hypothetical protein
LDEWRQNERWAKGGEHAPAGSIGPRTDAFAPSSGNVSGATNQNLSPQPSDPKAEHVESIRVARYRVVVEVALYDRLEPLPGCRHRYVHALLEFLFNFCQLAPHPLAYRVALHRKVSVPVLPADVR